MSTLKSSAENLTLNADGSNNDVIIQSDGSTVVTVDGSATSVGINETAPLGFLHVKNGDSGQGSINAAGNSLVLESNGSAGITFLTGSSSNGSIIWGDSESNYQGVILYDHSASAMKFITTGSERVRIIDDGLTFNGDTAAANALDDYEEGYHTLALTDSAGDVTSIALNSSYNQLAYTKIGRVVHISGTIVISSFSGSWQSDGTLVMTLPFTVADLTDNSGQSTFTVGSHNVDFTSGGSVYAQTSEGAASAQVYVSTDNTGAGKFQPASSGQLYIGGTFIAA